MKGKELANQMKNISFIFALTLSAADPEETDHVKIE